MAEDVLKQKWEEFIVRKELKQIVTCLVLCCLLITVFPMGVYAQSSSKDKADLVISSAREWNDFASKVEAGNTFSGKRVILSKDIRFTMDNPFKPVGKYDRKGSTAYGTFAGTFDGCGNTISGVDYVDERASMGLFLNVQASGKIQNLIVDDCNFSGDCGGIISALNVGEITNCHVINSRISCKHECSGIAMLNRGTIKNCSNNAAVETKQAAHTGGLVAINSGWIYNSFNGGTVSLIDCKIASSNYVAGIAGYFARTIGKDDKIQIYNCYNVGKIIVSGRTVHDAGIVGEWKNGTIKNCYYEEDTATGAYSRKYDDTSESNVSSMTLEHMSSKAFLKELNAAAGSSDSLLKWELIDTTPTLAPLYEVTFKSVKNGTVKTDHSYAGKGKKVSLTVLPNRNYKKASLSVKTKSGKKIKLTKKNSAGTKYTFIMPDEKVIVSAGFAKK